jgi:hypothetical protein
VGEGRNPTILGDFLSACANGRVVIGELEEAYGETNVPLGPLSPSLGITKEIRSRGPQVLDMEYREADDLSMGREGPSFHQCSPLITNNSIHPTSLVLK